MNRLRELLEIMARLRAADGCPWDRAQSFATIAPFTIEEAYEVADAAERGDMADLQGELGDLLFQVVFHSQMAKEGGYFDFDAVAGAMCDKLIRRHPHVFGERSALTAADQSKAWEDIKAIERSAAAAGKPPSASATTPSASATTPSASATMLSSSTTSHLAGVPQALPALMRAYKISKRAARVGFDFEHVSQTADKVAEELAEVREAAAQNTRVGPSPEIVEEIGDLLFAAANLARKLDVDAEAALRSANAKFERRFRGMELLAVQRGEIFAELSLDAQERLWQAVKRAE